MPNADAMDFPPVLSRWLDQLGRGFEIEHLVDQGTVEGSSLMRLDDAVHALVGDDLAPARFHQLPIAVLAQLAAIGHADYADVAAAATNALNSLTWGRTKDNLPVTLAAKLVANRLGAGTHSTVQMARLIEKLGLAGNVPGDEATRRALGTLCDTCKMPYPSIEMIALALGSFAQASGLAGPWHQVENAVLHARFTWPLLVWTRTGGGTSLPLRIHLYPKDGSTSRVRLRSHGKHFTDAGLMASAAEARAAAISLWQNINRSQPRTIRDQVTSADLTIDLTWLQEVRRRAGADIAIEPITWDSFEASLALSIFATLVDPAALEGVCATGTIGDPVPYDDHQIGRVAGVEAKLGRMAAMRLVDRGLYPAANTEANPAAMSLPGHLGVRAGETLSAYVRATMPRDGSSNDFMRCPDLEAVWRDKDRSNSEEVTEALARVRRGGHVVEMPEGTAPQTVIRALLEQNRSSRANAATYRTAHPDTGLEDVDFLQSVTVIRATPYETNERFWRVLWDLLDGTESEWSKFTRAVSKWTAAVHLANLLHRNLAPGRLRRVPDRIVIVGARHLSNTQNLCPNGPFKRLQLNVLKDSLAAELAKRSPLSPHRAEVLGPARLILVPDDGLAERPKLSATVLSEDLRQPFHQLATFKYDFTVDAARLMLDCDDHDTRTILNRLGQVQAYDVPVAAPVGREGSDRWILNIQPMEFGSAEAQRDRHLAAAEALVGFRKGDHAHFANYRRALAPAVVHDAQNHLRLAERFANDVAASAGSRTSTTSKTNVDAKNAIKNAGVRLALLAEPLSWTTVRWAVGMKGEADSSLLEAAIAYTDGVRADTRRRTGRWAHPLEIALLIRLIGVHLLRIHRDVHHAKETAWLLPLLDDLQTDGLTLCATLDRDFLLDGVNEGNACRFAVLSTYLAVQMDLNPSWAQAQAFKDGFKSAASLAHAAREVPDPRFFVYLGDYEARAHIAALHYKRGFFEEQGVVAIRERRNAEVLLKYLGAALQADLAEVTDALLEQVKREISPGMKAYIARTTQPSFGISDLVAKNRWTIGRNFFLEGTRPNRIPPAKAVVL